MRWPGGKVCPMPLRSKTTSSVSPGGQSSVRSRPCRAARLSTPRVTRVEEPSGATSQSRATAWPRGTSIRRRSFTRGRPRISIGASATGNSNDTDFASSSRWSGGRSASLPNGKKRPASTPVCCGEATIRSPPWRAYATGETFSEGQLASPTQRPGSVSYTVAGGCEPLIQDRSSGSRITPVSWPLRCWSHQRSVSWRKPIAGPGGSPRSGYWCDQGPISPRTCSGSRCSTSRRTVSRYGSCQPPTARTFALIAP